MKIKMRQLHLNRLLLIISFCIFNISRNENTLGNLNSKEISCQCFQVNLQWAINPISQLNKISKKNTDTDDKKRQSGVKKKAQKNENPSKLRYLPRKTKPKINRKNGVNRYYAV